MDNPYFSIITCAYNSGEYIKECLISIEKQTFKNYEHILVYSPSKDNTLNIINDYITRNKHNNSLIKTIESEPKGISNAMNLGIKESNGKIIQILHTDDYYINNNVLEDIYKYFINDEKLDCLIGNKTLLYQNAKSKLLFNLKSGFIYQKLGKILIYIFNWVPHSATFIKKDVFKKHGYFREDLEYGMDYEFWLRTLNNIKFKTIKKDFVIYRRHKDSKSGALKNVLHMYKEDLKIKTNLILNK